MKLSSETLAETASNFITCYPNDLEAALIEELVQFAALFNDIVDKQKANLGHSDGKCIKIANVIVCILWETSCTLLFKKYLQ